MIERYTIKNFRKLLTNPSYIGWELQRILYDYQYSNKSVDVMDEDWDNLILLDACRYDYFKEQNTISGVLTSVVSHGGASWEFMQGNFVGRQFHDTVYITGNPHTGKLSQNTFHEIKPLYLTSWDAKYETVLPRDVVDAAVDAHGQFPDKRLIVHFMQPHRPYLGDTGRHLQAEHNISGFNRKLAYTDETPDGPSFSQLIETGDISIERTRKAYSETLDIALDHVEELINKISGKTIVSADHGELLGEQIFPFTTPEFGHSHEYIRNETLYRVPWLEVPFNRRRETTEDPPLDSELGASEAVEDRLRALGYMHKE